MTNPPYILEHLEAMAAILRHPRVYAFLHIPVQAGADEVLARTSDTQVEALGEGGRMTNIVYLTEVRGVKVLAGAMTAPDSGGEIGPDAEAELADLLTKQVEKVNNAG